MPRSQTIANVVDTSPTQPAAGPQYQCGRCRAYFPAAADIDPRLLKEWWACPPCRAVLFPSKDPGAVVTRATNGGAS